jgi:hypothetical protein
MTRMGAAQWGMHARIVSSVTPGPNSSISISSRPIDVVTTATFQTPFVDFLGKIAIVDERARTCGGPVQRTISA